MSFLTVYNAVCDQIENNTNLLTYVKESNFIKGFKEVLPAKRYMVIIEPGPEAEIGPKKGYKHIMEMQYEIHVYCRLLLQSSKVESAIIGNDTYKGLLEFAEDVKDAIREDMSFAYNKYGRSVSVENVAGSFDLDATIRYLTVSIDGKTPSGYDTIDCGSSTLMGAEIATNIQTALRVLGRYADDGYQEATCVFNSANNQFTINSANIGPQGTVMVTAGVSNDASSLLGFTNPINCSGTNITKTTIDPVQIENGAFPVRYRMIPIAITEETLIGG